MVFGFRAVHQSDYTWLLKVRVGASAGLWTHQPSLSKRKGIEI